MINFLLPPVRGSLMEDASCFYCVKLSCRRTVGPKALHGSWWPPSQFMLWSCYLLDWMGCLDTLMIKGEKSCRARSEPDGTRWRTGGEVMGKLANGVGSQYSHATSERGISSIIEAYAHTSAASSRLNWHPYRIKWTHPFQGKTKSGFCACAITFRTSYTYRAKGI